MPLLLAHTKKTKVKISENVMVLKKTALTSV